MNPQLPRKRSWLRFVAITLTDMKKLLPIIAFCGCLLSAMGQTQSPEFNPDYDGDGCFGTSDFLQVLAVFGECETIDPGHTLYYFRKTSGSQYPFGDLLSGDVIYLGSEEDPFYSSTTDVAEAWEWLIANQSPTNFEVIPLDSVPGVTLPFSESIPAESIQFPDGEGPYYMVVYDGYDIDWESAHVFFDVNNGAGLVPLSVGFTWNGEPWRMMKMPWAGSAGAITVGVSCAW